VSLSAFAFLFSEIVQYFQNRVDSVSDLEKKLEELGYGVGLRMVELISIKDRATKRETRLINMLQYLSSTVWKHLFHKVADNLERSNENEDECKRKLHARLLHPHL
jgi:trafficking protein particle complex subunit 5